MADGNQILREMIGTPFVWLYTAKDEILKYFDGEPIIKYLIDFSYRYDEENDDKCEIRMHFETLRGFELPYIKQDVILKVQWGYILEDNKTLRSPVRTIAIRDIEYAYKDKGIEVSLICTDLASYKRSFQLKTRKNYSNPGAKAQAAMVGREYDILSDYLYNVVAEGSTRITTTDKFGIMDIYDPKVVRAQINNSTNEPTVKQKQIFSESEINAAADANATNYIDPYYKGDGYMGYTGKPLKSIAMGQVVTATSINFSPATRLALEQLTKLENPIAGGIGKTVADGTDNRIDIKKRNYNQPPFRSFTFAGDTGELIEFTNNTQTGRIEVNTAASSSIDPYNKNIQSVSATTGDLNEEPPTDNNNVPGERMFIIPRTKEEQEKLESEKFKEELATSLNWDLKKISQDNQQKYEIITQERNRPYIPSEKRDQTQVNRPNYDLREPYTVKPNKGESYKELQKLTYSWMMQNLEDVENGVSLYNLTKEQEEQLKAIGFSKADYLRTINVQRYNGHIPIGNDFGMGLSNMIRAEKVKKINAILATNYLMNTVVEQIVRKYSARANVIGDPSLIKGKTYNFNNLGPANNGLWYAKAVTHSIKPGAGYMTELTLERAPKQIFYSNRVYSVNPVYDEDKDELTFEEKLEIESGVSGESITKTEDDQVLLNDNHSSEDTIEDKEERLDRLREFDNIANNG